MKKWLEEKLKLKKILVSKKIYGSTCSSSSQCQDTALLQCISGTCGCNSTQYWTSTICKSKEVSQS